MTQVLTVIITISNKIIYTTVTMAFVTPDCVCTRNTRPGAIPWGVYPRYSTVISPIDWMVRDIMDSPPAFGRINGFLLGYYNLFIYLFLTCAISFEVSNASREWYFRFLSLHGPRAPNHYSCANKDTCCVFSEKFAFQFTPHTYTRPVTKYSALMTCEWNVLV